MCKKLSSYLSDFFRKIDIFSVGVRFNIEKEEEFGTMLGGFVFLCYFFVCVYFIVTNFFYFVDRSIYNQNIIDIKAETAPPINLFDDKIALVFGLTVDNSPDINYDDISILDYVSVSTTYVVKYAENSTKIKQILNLTNCEKSHFGNRIDSTFELFSLEKYKCIDHTNNEELFLQGIYTDAIFKYIEFSVKIKKEAMNETVFLENFLLDHEIKLQLFYLDSSINVSNYHNPEKLYLNSRFLDLSFPFVVKANVDFSNNTFQNDANILLSTDSSFNFFSLELFEETRIYRGSTRLSDKKNDYDLLGKMYLRASQSSVIYKRTYQKITEYLADSTSIVSQVLFLLVLILGEYNQFKAKEYIIDNMLKYKDKFINQNSNGYSLMKKLFTSKPQDTFDNAFVNTSSVNGAEITSNNQINIDSATPKHKIYH